MDIASPSSTDHFLLALQAYQELQAEIDPQACPAPAEVEAPSADLEPATAPDGSLLLGLAEDGLPLVLNLYDPSPGPILVAGEARSGKTSYLHSLAQATERFDPGEIQFGALTPFPEEWQSVEGLSGCMGIWPSYHPSAGSFLRQLADWADTLMDSRQIVLLLIDGLEMLSQPNVQFRQDLLWLLSYGPERHVWPIVAAHPGRLDRLERWLEYFPTRILGTLRQRQVAQMLVGDPAIDLARLIPCRQFGLWMPGSWMKFWALPTGYERETP
jgi:hypothetical protein